jgi:GTP-sensing pleiotropic transcriptional regulator CodY
VDGAQKFVVIDRKLKKISIFKNPFEIPDIRIKFETIIEASNSTNNSIIILKTKKQILQLKTKSKIETTLWLKALTKSIKPKKVQMQIPNYKQTISQF